MDLSVFDSLGGEPNHEPARAAEKSRRWILDMQEAFTTLEKARMPVIAAIQGACIGGGVDMICAADMRFCTANAFFNIKETELGITCGCRHIAAHPACYAQRPSPVNWPTVAAIWAPMKRLPAVL